MKRPCEGFGGLGVLHLVIRPLGLVDEVQAAVHDERIHVARILAEAGDAVAALL